MYMVKTRKKVKGENMDVSSAHVARFKMSDAAIRKKIDVEGKSPSIQ